VRIEKTVAEAEAKTSAEIVPAVATASGRYDRAEDLIGLWTGLLLLTVVWYIYPHETPSPDYWGFSWASYEVLALLAAMLAGFLGGALLGARIWILRHLFTPRNHMRDEVYERARQAFFDARVYETAGGTGILFYISLYERMAAVIADRTVLEKLGQNGLDDLCCALTEGIAKGDPTTALCSVIADAGEKLAAVLPRAADDVDEISNKLVILN
jgi:putative membrane protein